MESDTQTTALLRRIEELAARAADDEQQRPEGPVLAAALTGLRAELGGLRADLGTLRADLSAVRAGMDAGTGRLGGALEATRSQTEDLGTRHDELAGKVDTLTDAIADIKGALPEIRSLLVDQPSISTAIQTAVGRLQDNLEARVDTLGEDLRRTLSAGMTQAAAGSRAAETAWTDARSAAEERLAAIEDTLDALAERLEAVTRDSYTSTDERLGRVESRLEDMSATLLPEAVASQERWGDEIRGALGHVATALDRSLGSLGESLTDAVRLNSDADRSHVDEVLAQQREAIDEAVATLDQRISLTRDNASAANADLRGFLSSFQAATEARLEDVRSALAGGLVEARSNLVNELRTTIDSLESANGDTRRLVEEEIVTLRGDLADALEEVRERIASTVVRANDAITASVDGQREEFSDLVRELRSTVLDRLEESTATVATGLDELRGGVTSAARAGEVTTARVTEFAETMGSLEEIVGEMHADWDRRTNAAIDVVAAAGEAAVGEFRAEVQAVIAELKDSVDAGTHAVSGTTGVVTTATERLVTAGQALVGYLARRDEILEAERDRVVHEVLDEFAQGLTAKERRGMGERVGAALERRRDARDAERYRRSAEGLPAVESPEIPAHLSLLTEPLPEPKKPKPAAKPKAPAAAQSPGPAKAAAAQRPALARAAKASPAKKANAVADKRAPATRSSRTAAPPAKKAAKRAPVKRTAAKKAAPAKQATPDHAPAKEKETPAKETSVRVPAAEQSGPAPTSAPADAPEVETTTKATEPAKRPARRTARKAPSSAPTTTPPDETTQANTTEPLDGEGTTRV